MSNNKENKSDIPVISNIVEIENLTKDYGELTAVDNLSLNIREGEVFGLLGPNGSGKTTTINCMLSLINYNRGKIKYLEKKCQPRHMT